MGNTNASASAAFSDRVQSIAASPPALKGLRGPAMVSTIPLNLQPAHGGGAASATAGGAVGAMAAGSMLHNTKMAGVMSSPLTGGGGSSALSAMPRVGSTSRISQRSVSRSAVGSQHSNSDGTTGQTLFELQSTEPVPVTTSPAATADGDSKAEPVIVSVPIYTIDAKEAAYVWNQKKFTPKHDTLELVVAFASGIFAAAQHSAIAQSKAAAISSRPPSRSPSSSALNGGGSGSGSAAVSAGIMKHSPSGGLGVGGLRSANSRSTSRIAVGSARGSGGAAPHTTNANVSPAYNANGSPVLGTVRHRLLEQAMATLRRLMPIVDQNDIHTLTDSRDVIVHYTNAVEYLTVQDNEEEDGTITIGVATAAATAAGGVEASRSASISRSLKTNASGSNTKAKSTSAGGADGNTTASGEDSDDADGDAGGTADEEDEDDDATDDDADAKTVDKSPKVKAVTVKPVLSSPVSPFKFDVNSDAVAAAKYSALLTSAAQGTSSLFATFGGQGYAWLDELRELWHTYPAVQPFVRVWCGAIQAQVNTMEAQVLGFYRYGFDVLSWIQNSNAAPGFEYLISAPISYPMIGFTQFVTFLSCLQNLHHLTPAQFVSRLSGASGHSQGIVSAVVIASSSSVSDYQARVCGALTYLFWHGARAQQIVPLNPVSSRVAIESVNRGFTSAGSVGPTPMLAVRGLDLKVLRSVCGKVNAMLGGEKSKVFVSLINGPNAAIVSGDPLSLHSLRVQLASIHAPTSDPNDQAKVPFSQRKPIFSCTYLAVSVPFHTPLLKDAVPLILADCKRLRLSLVSSELKIPVYATNDARNLQRVPNDEFLTALVTMQCVEAVDWLKICTAVIAPNAFAGTGSVAAPPPAAVVPSSGDVKGDAKPIAATASAVLKSAAAAKPVDVTHVLDFGCGGSSGTARLTQNITEGSGLVIVLCGAVSFNKLDAGGVNTKVMVGKRALLDKLAVAPPSPNWGKLFAPKVVRVAGPPKSISTASVQPAAADSKAPASPPPTPAATEYAIETRFTRVFGRPPVMVAGMTPTTVNEQFVSAVSLAGYNVELAGGGQVNERMFRARIQSLTASLPAGSGITVNLLFLNPRQWGFQFPLALAMRREGYPIESITVAAGIPSPAVAEQILTQCHAVGITRVGFKPGNADAIRQVVAIAQRSTALFGSSLHVVLQWTGGRAGGHHSLEDQHVPLLQTYGLIRSCDNIVLVIGGGFGSGADAIPYLTGSWSTPVHPPMPIDGILVASRMMTAKECMTEESVKQLIVAAPGVTASAGNEHAWEKSLIPQPAPVAGKPAPNLTAAGAGGVVTITSELNENIHQIANAGTSWWAHMDSKYFSLGRDKFGELVKSSRAVRRTIIDGFNAYSHKPFFGQKLDGRTAYELTEMTYAEVAVRLINIMCPKPVAGGHARPREWVDPSFRTRFVDWIRYCVERFAAQSAAGSGEFKSVSSAGVLNTLSKSAVLNSTPELIVAALRDSFPGVDSLCLSSEDELQFVALCKKRGKPVPFIFVLDADLKQYMKKDSLWYSEDLRTVPNRDPNRVMILTGPLSVRHCTAVNEPVKQILDGINRGMIHGLTAGAVSSPAAATVFGSPLVVISPQLQTANAAPTPAGSMLPAAGSPKAAPQLFTPYAVTVTPATGAAAEADGDSDNQLPAAGVETSPEVNAILNDFEVSSDRARLALRVPFNPSSVDGTQPAISINGWIDTLVIATATKSAVGGSAWIRALLRSPQLIRGKLWTVNAVSRMFHPKPGMSVELRAAPLSRSGTPPQPGDADPTDAASSIDDDDGTSEIDQILLFDSTLTPTPAVGSRTAPVPIVHARYFAASRVVALTIRHPSPTQTGYAELRLQYSVVVGARAGQEPYLLEEGWSVRCEKIINFYRALWANPAAAADSKKSVAESPLAESVISAEAIKQFRAATGDSSIASDGAATEAAPIDMSIVLAWSPIVNALFAGCGAKYGFADLFSLVHLSNQFQVLKDGNGSVANSTLHAGDRIRVTAKLIGVWDDNSLRTISVRAVIAKLRPSAAAGDSKSAAVYDPCVEVESAFAIRGGAFQTKTALSALLHPAGSAQIATPPPPQFRETANEWSLTLADTKVCRVLGSKAWHNVPAAELVSGRVLTVTCQTRQETIPNPAGAAADEDADDASTPAAHLYSFVTTGTIADASTGVVIGTISCSQPAALNCVVVGFMGRFAIASEQSGRQFTPPQSYPLQIWQTPISNHLYARASQDVNPIHTSAAVASYAGLPTTITHGMCSSAVGRQLVAAAATAAAGANGAATSVVTGGMITRWKANFTGMVTPNTRTNADIQLVSVRRGAKILALTLRSAETNAVLMTATAEMEQPPTAVLFTGQGSAVVGMGMELYASSAAARKVWDAAEQYFVSKYGFSM